MHSVLDRERKQLVARACLSSKPSTKQNDVNSFNSLQTLTFTDSYIWQPTMCYVIESKQSKYHRHALECGQRKQARYISAKNGVE